MLIFFLLLLVKLEGFYVCHCSYGLCGCDRRAKMDEIQILYANHPL